MKNGETIRICDMDDRHLTNTIALLERNGAKWLAEETAACGSVLSTLSGEMASYYCEQDFDRLCEMSVEDFLGNHVPVYNDLRNERSRRELLRMQQSTKEEVPF